MRLREPNGYHVDIIHGVAPADLIAIDRQVANTGAAPLARAGVLLRLPKAAPTPVKRLAHVVLGSNQVPESVRWYADTLGLLTSDEVFTDIGGDQIGAFMRLDKGEEYVDHHVFFVVRSPVVGLQHVSFEAQDMDAVLADHHFLKQTGRYEHLWGIGRHLLGSQMFDYWMDPFGYVHEHWADTDRLNATAPTTQWAARDGLSTQWGEPANERFRASVKP